jgi:hypothetical protein
MLRNEQPVFLTLDDQPPGFLTLGTGANEAVVAGEPS